MENILFVDGRNFISKLKFVINDRNINEVDFSFYDFEGLFEKVLRGIKVDRRIFYLGKLLKHENTAKKSEILIGEQRKLKTHLENQGFEIIIAGRVRGHLEKCSRGHEMLVFKEKGVDVKIAVDLATLACDKKLNLAVVASSDSDLQPAISELKKRNVERIYLGFETNPNKGLTYTTNRTILIRNSEVVEFLPKKLF
jgi:uncharacterized LabA/DUF88 family protein